MSDWASSRKRYVRGSRYGRAGFSLRSIEDSGGRFGQSQSLRTSESIMRFAAREASVLDKGSTERAEERAESDPCEPFEPFRRREVRFCRKGAALLLLPSTDGRGED